jgi:V-type H+-transporting ATPase subunit E
MSLSDNDVQKQLRHMMAFIEQEANEKAEEIDAKAEEEFNIEKGRLVQQQRAKIMEHYEKKEKQVELQRKIQNSNMHNQARLRLLKARQDHINAVLEEARGKLSTLANDSGRYESVLRGLITAALCQLLEDKVDLRCRERDVAIVTSVLPDCIAASAKQSHKTPKVTIDTSNYLPADCAGGVEVYKVGGKIRVSSTLESRLALLSHTMVPDIRTALFGANPNRRFNE